MRKIFTAIIVITLISCSKDPVAPTPPPPPPPVKEVKFTDFLDKYLVCDSIVSTDDGKKTTEILGEGKGSDVLFATNGNFTLYSTPQVNASYQYKANDTIYYWPQGATMDPSRFFLITSMTEKNVVTRETLNINKIRDYFHHLK